MCRVWDAATGQPVTDWFVMTETAGQSARPPSALTAGLSLVSHGLTLRIHDARPASQSRRRCQHNHHVMLQSLAASAPTAAGSSPAASTARCGSGTRRTGKLAVPAMKHTHWNGASFSPDGRWVLSWSWSGDQTARVWNAATGVPRCDPMRHPAPVSSRNSAPTAPAWPPCAMTMPSASGTPLLAGLSLPPLWHLAPLTGFNSAPTAGTCSPRAGPDGPRLGPGRRQPRRPAAHGARTQR